MAFVKILGLIDIAAAIIFLMFVFSMAPPFRVILFCAGLLLLKGMFIFTGEVPLSLIDLFSSGVLLISLFFNPPVVLLWIPAFLLLAKGFVSFI